MGILKEEKKRKPPVERTITQKTHIQGNSLEEIERQINPPEEPDLQTQESPEDKEADIIDYFQSIIPLGSTDPFLVEVYEYHPEIRHVNRQWQYKDDVRMSDIRHDVFKAMFGAGTYKLELYREDNKGKKIRVREARPQEFTIAGEPPGENVEYIMGNNNGDADKPIPPNPLDTFRVAGEFYKDAFESGQSSTPQQPQSFDAVIQPFAKVFNTLADTMAKHMSTMDGQRAEIAKQERVANDMTIKAIQQMMDGQLRLNEKNLEVQNAMFDGYRKLYELREEMGDGGKTSIIDLIAKAFDKLPALIPLLSLAQTPPLRGKPSQTKLKSSPAPESSIPQPATATATATAIAVEESGKEEEGEESLLDDAEYLIFKAFQKKYDYETLLKVLDCNYEADEVRELYIAWQQQAFSEEFYKNKELSEYLSGAFQYALNLLTGTTQHGIHAEDSKRDEGNKADTSGNEGAG